MYDEQKFCSWIFLVVSSLDSERMQSALIIIYDKAGRCETIQVELWNLVIYVMAMPCLEIDGLDQIKIIQIKIV